MAADLSEKVFTIGPASRLLEKSPDTIRKWVKAGKLKATRTITGQLLFTLADLEECAERERARRAAAATPAA